MNRKDPRHPEYLGSPSGRFLDAAFAQQTPPSNFPGMPLSNFPGATPILQPRSTQPGFPNYGSSSPIPGVSINSAGGGDSVVALSSLSPELRRLVVAEMEAKSPKHPAAPQPSPPADDMRPADSMTIPVSALKRPANSMTAVHAEQQSLEPLRKKRKCSSTDHDYDDLYSDLPGDDVFGGNVFCARPKQ